MSIRTPSHSAALLIAGYLIALLGSPLVLANGEDDAPPPPNCPKGQVWDSKTQKCVLLTSGAHALTSIHQAPENP